MIKALFAMLLVAGGASPFDNSKRLAEAFLEAFLNDPRSVASLVTQDALFATIDNSGPLAEVIEDPSTIKTWLRTCKSGPVTTRPISKDTVKNLPGDTFKDGLFVAAEGLWLCSPPGGAKVRVQARLVLKDGKVAFFGVYPSRGP